MNLKQAARRLGVHYQTAYRWVRAGRLAAVRVGNGYEISEQAIERLLAEADAMRRHSLDDEKSEVEGATSSDALVRAAHCAYNTMALSPRSVFEVVSDGLARVLGDLAVVRVLGDNDVLVTRAVHHTNPRRHSIAWTGFEMYTRTMNEPHERVAIATRKPVLIRHLPQDQLRAHTAPELIQYLDDARPHSLICVPACYRGEAKGVITLSREFPNRPYAPEDVALVTRLAAIVGAAVVRAADAQDAWCRRRSLMTALADRDAPADEIENCGDLMSDGSAAELICSIDGRILCANRAAGDLGAVTPEALVGRSVDGLALDEYQVVERELLARLAIGELTYADTSCAVAAGDGTRKDVAVHHGIVRNAAAQPTAIVVVANAVPEPETCGVSFAAAS
jgi:excisionase family DNA binding protein